MPWKNRRRDGESTPGVIQPLPPRKAKGTPAKTEWDALFTVEDDFFEANKLPPDPLEIEAYLYMRDNPV